MYCNKNLDNLLRLILILDPDVQSRDLQRQLFRRCLAYYAAHVTEQRCNCLKMSPFKGLLHSCEAQCLQLVQQFFTSALLFLTEKRHCSLVVIVSSA